jgi:hypothetical protein
MHSPKMAARIGVSSGLDRITVRLRRVTFNPYESKSKRRPPTRLKEDARECYRPTCGDRSGTLLALPPGWIGADLLPFLEGVPNGDA